jgi:hypothetical protein
MYKAYPQNKFRLQIHAELLLSLCIHPELDSLKGRGPITIHLSQRIESHVLTNHRTLKFRWRHWALVDIYCSLLQWLQLWWCVIQLIGKYEFWFYVVKQRVDIYAWVTSACYFCTWMVCLLHRMKLETYMKSKSVATIFNRNHISVC